MLQIHVPKDTYTHPFYSTRDGHYIDLVDQSILFPDQVDLTGFRYEIRSEYHDQPVLIRTLEGCYMVQTNPPRLNNAPLIAVESPILGVYPLYGIVRYNNPFDKKVLNCLRNLIYRKEPIFELTHFE